jgi:hypothetical protein
MIMAVYHHILQGVEAGVMRVVDIVAVAVSVSVMVTKSVVVSVVER